MEQQEDYAHRDIIALQEPQQKLYALKEDIIHTQDCQLVSTVLKVTTVMVLQIQLLIFFVLQAHTALLEITPQM
jgi:hypothetical protein